MAETNSATDDKSTTVADDDKEVTEDDLRDLKYGNDEVETSEEADETVDTADDNEDSEEAGEEDETSESQDEETEETDKTETDDDSSYVKEFPNIKGDTLEDYSRNLEEAYKNSTAEALRLKGIVDGKQTETSTEETTEVSTSDPLSLYMKQKMDEEISVAFTDFSKDYSQVNDPSEYAKFTNEVAVISQTILNSQKRLAPPKELYSKAAVILGWESNASPTGKERVGMAVKSTAAVSKSSSGTGKPKTKSKVTDAMIAASKLMYPGKSDQEIREELEPYV